MGAGTLIRTELVTDPRTSGLVGVRVHPQSLVEAGEFPQIVYHQISGARQYSHDGDSGLRSPRYQFDIWAKDPDTAESVAEALIEVLSGRSFAGIRFSLVLDERDDVEERTGLFRRIVDAMPHLEN